MSAIAAPIIESVRANEDATDVDHIGRVWLRLV